MSSPVRVVMACLCAIGCSESPSPPQWHQESGYRWRELAVPRRGRDGFRQLAPSRTGIDFTNRVTADQIIENEHVLNGSGVAIGDVDGDGRADIYLARLDGPNALYRNLGEWRFADVAPQAGVAAGDRFSTGAALADTDGDGDLDLVLTSLGGPNSLFINQGGGVFHEHPDAGLASTLGSTTAALADIEGDGDLDLYVANYKRKSVRDIYPPAVRAFDQVVQQVGERYVIRPEFREHYRVVMQHDRVMRIEIGEPDQLYVNDGSGRFTRVPFTDGRFRDEDGAPLAAPPADWTLAARFHDIDGDGDPDLFVCNDFESPDLVWINDGAGRFRLADPRSIRTTSQSAMAVDFADIDRDGDVDIFEVDMLDPHSGRRKTQVPPVAPDQPALGDVAGRVQSPRNILLINRGDGSFAEAARYAGVAASGWSWSALFLDVDLDGYEDILIGTGHAYDFLDADTHRRLQRRSLDAAWRRTRLLFPRLDLPNRAFRNRGDRTFEDLTEPWGFGREPDVSHGMAAGDLDGDGDLDIVLNRLGRPAAVLRNESTRPRIAVRLRGRPSNTRGVGAVIRVSGGPVPEQSKEVTAGGLYLSSAEPVSMFAAGDGDDLSITVHWRSGRRSVVPGARPNRFYEIAEPAGAAPEHAAEPADAATAQPFFMDVSNRIDHRHVEREYRDFGRQPLLPNRLSELGPGVAWSDIDRDGDPDLLVGTGRGGRLAVYRNGGGRFTRVTLRMDAAPLDQSAIVALPAPAGTALLVGQMNYEAESPAAARMAAAVLRLDLGAPAIDGRDLVPRVSTAVPGEESSTGPLALADYDGDGDLDLFVGGRVLPARYPTPASSRLYRNQDGRFVLDSLNSALLRRLGLVSGAAFSDMDGDGDPDLLLAVEWGPLRFFSNDAGRFQDATAAHGLDRYRSRWNGITTGDFDEDGRLDIVATSWGRNTSPQPTERHPLFLYYDDFDGNGITDVVTAQYDPRVEAVAPLRGFQELALAIPPVGRRIGSFSQYAEADLQEVLGPGAEQAAIVETNSLEHMLLLNRGGAFDAVPLPGEAQLAPAFYAGVADFDGDGHEDVFLTQNFSATVSGASPYNAGRALWLSGDGTGRLTAVPGHVSGIAVYGDQRGAALADFDEDGRVDVAISQNANRTMLYRNRGATPGLTVHLVGPAGNPDAIGATMRLVYGRRRGPARDVKAGSGYWSLDSPVAVLGIRKPPTALWVRWPGGAESTTPLRPATRQVTVRAPAGGPVTAR
ncbi:MAG: FG-GAP repeat domain-containing protein [Gemmatimonadales bacterium]